MFEDRLEELPGSKKINITVRKAQFWIAFLTVILIFISSFIVYPIVYVQGKNYVLNENTRAIAEQDQRLKNIENLIPEIDEANRQMQEIINELKTFRSELNESKEEWLKLFRDFDLKKKK